MNETDQRRNKISGLFPKAALIKISTYKNIINFIHKKNLSLSKFILVHNVQAKIQKQCNQIKDKENEFLQTKKDLFKFECANSSDNTFEKRYDAVLNLNFARITKICVILTRVAVS